MVTVFDVATHEELMEMFGDEDEELTEEELRKEYMSSDAETNNAELALLYAGRGNMEKAEEYLALIKNDQYRMDTAWAINEATD